MFYKNRNDYFLLSYFWARSRRYLYNNGHVRKAAAAVVAVEICSNSSRAKSTCSSEKKRQQQQQQQGMSGGGGTGRREGASMMISNVPGPLDEMCIGYVDVAEMFVVPPAGTQVLASVGAVTYNGMLSLFCVATLDASTSLAS